MRRPRRPSDAHCRPKAAVRAHIDAVARPGRSDAVLARRPRRCLLPRLRTRIVRVVLPDAHKIDSPLLLQWGTPEVTTVLDKELKRQITVDGVAYTVAVDPDGFRLTGKGKRTPQVELRWRDLLSGDAAMAVALNASLSTKRPPAPKPMKELSPDRAGQRVPRKPQR